MFGVIRSMVIYKKSTQLMIGVLICESKDQTKFEVKLGSNQVLHWRVIRLALQTRFYNGDLNSWIKLLIHIILKNQLKMNILK